MTTLCAQNNHHIATVSGGAKALREVHIPPRKLLNHRNSSGDILPEEALMIKFLPYNRGEDDDDADPYATDHFRMFEFKVRRCTRSRSHDWTDCPFAHPGEKARRRDPRRYHYSGTVCAEFRRGSCSRGDNCEFAHGVFECWLHPARYRTEACKDGKNCKRKICFFAHSVRELRVLPEVLPEVSPVANNHHHHHHHCCMYCNSSMNSSSPTSTLLGMCQISPPLSPPLSPASPMKPSKRSVNGFSPVSRYGDRVNRFEPEFLSYKDVVTLAEIMGSLESMSLNHESPEKLPAVVSEPWGPDLEWVDELLM